MYIHRHLQTYHQVAFQVLPLFLKFFSFSFLFISPKYLGHSVYCVLLMLGSYESTLSSLYFVPFAFVLFNVASKFVCNVIHQPPLREKETKKVQCVFSTLARAPSSTDARFAQLPRH